MTRARSAAPLLLGAMLLLGFAALATALWASVRNEALATGQVQIGVVDSSELRYLWRQTYTRSEDPGLFWCHVLSWFALPVLCVCSAAVCGLLGLVALIGGPEARATGMLQYCVVGFASVGAVAAVHWVIFFWLFRFGLGQALGLVDPTLGAGPR